MDKDTRNAIERATQRGRKLLEEDFAAQLEGDFDVQRDGAVAAKAGGHLSPRQTFQRERIVAAIEHKRAAGMIAADAARDYLRDAAFTTLNRFVALKMLEARDLVQECITKGEQSAGYREFCGMAPGLPLLPDSAGYRLYIESLFDELSTEVKVLFDRRDPSSVLWPKRATFEQLLEILNATELARVWGEDETIGWVYQFFNGQDERKKMREENQAPRNSRELAVRNQFFTPRYVVQFLTDNTLGRIWYEMRGTSTVLADKCEFMVRKPGEAFAPRAKKDPRDLRVLDPACGSGHFLLYAFDLLLAIYEEAYADPESPKSEATGKTLAEDYPSLDALRKAIPGLVLAHNLHGVDIDPRCAQIAQVALWMRAQKAYREFGIVGAERAQIRRSNIVVAEPLVADEQTAKEFVAKLGDIELGSVFTSLVESLSLAGDLGLLLKAEKLVSRDVARGKTGDLFAPPEERIRSALARFAGDHDARPSTRRRLFAEDTQHGLGLTQVASTRYDALLMNPPFGDATPEAARYLEERYPETRLDLFAAFCERLLELAQPNGLVGAITPRDGFFKKTLGGWRQRILANRLTVVADLGIGVLDTATVRVAAYVMARGKHSGTSRFIDLVDLPDRDARLREEVAKPVRHFDVDMARFQSLPLSRFLYWLPARLWEIYESADSLENRSCTPRYGLTTLSDERFCRLFFELVPTSIGVSLSWVFMSKGGNDYPYGGVSNSVVRWENDASEMAEVNRQANGQVAQTRRASKYYFRPALSFSNRSVQFSVRWHPANYVFSVRGPAVVPLAASSAYLLGFFNSRLVRALIQMQTASQTYTSGVLKELRWVEPDDATRVRVEQLAVRAFAACRECLGTIETDPCFAGLVPSSEVERVQDWNAYVDWQKSTAESLNLLLRDCQAGIDQSIAALYGVASEDVERCERAEEEVESRFPPTFEFPLSPGDALASFLVGVTFGRWHATPRKFAARLESAVPETQPALALQRSQGILVDDEGHPDDLVGAVRAALRRVLPRATDLDEMGLERAIGSRSLREWYARAFWGRHLTAYSGFGRKAPIYWQLATPSAGYSVWLYLHAFSKDTLFRVQNDYVAPKLAHEERRLESLTSELREGATAAQRKQLAVQEALVEELRAFLDAVKRVAPLWKPNLDDGVIINFAPLWRLVPQNKSWQKELKSTWDALCEGKCDWAHLAMHLWPERVVPKCAKDRSLAIAHGLEDVFWVKDMVGTWVPRRNRARTLDYLASYHISDTVVSALDEVRNLWKTRYADTGCGNAAWWKSLESGGHDDCPVAMKLWPERVMQRVRRAPSIALAHGFPPPVVADPETTEVETRRRSRTPSPLLSPSALRALTDFCAELGEYKTWQERWVGLDQGDFDDGRRGALALVLLVRPRQVMRNVVSELDVARAFGLERWFWIKGNVGWRPVCEPAVELETALEGRRSPAVKSALKNLLDAPVASGKSAGRKSGGRRKATAAAVRGDA